LQNIYALEGNICETFFHDIISLHIIIGTLFARTATFMTILFLSIYLTKVKGISPVEAGTIIGISAFVGLFYTLFT